MAGPSASPAPVTSMMIHTAKVASSQLWTIDTTSPGTAHPRLGPVSLSGGGQPVVITHTRVTTRGDSRWTQQALGRHLDHLAGAE